MNSSYESKINSEHNLNQINRNLNLQSTFQKSYQKSNVLNKQNKNESFKVGYINRVS